MISRAFLLAALVLPLPGQLAWRDLGDGRMELRDGGKPAMVYNYGVQRKEGAPEERSRCCYIFPVYTPGGVSMLDDFPSDHWHHRGLFWAWPVVEVEGKTYDLWMSFTARARSAKRPTAKGSTLEAENLWEAGGRDIVRETVRIVPRAAEGDEREFRIELNWRALGSPVMLRGSREEGKSYGGFSARFAPREGTVLRADDEALLKDEDLNRRQWAELEGIYAGKRAILRITPDDGDPDAPYQWCLRRYGFVGASFPGRYPAADGYLLEPKRPLNLKFTVRVSD